MSSVQFLGILFLLLVTGVALVAVLVVKLLKTNVTVLWLDTDALVDQVVHCVGDGNPLTPTGVRLTLEGHETLFLSLLVFPTGTADVE